MESPLDRYLRTRATRLPEALGWIEKQTNIRTNHARMLSGPVQGMLLKMLVEISGARRILEIGTFTGYSSACMALGLPRDGGHIDTIELGDELNSLIMEGWRRAGVDDRITLHTGDALELIPTLEPFYDLVFIDANKREYPQYYRLCLPLVRQGGLILADDVLWDSKVYAEPPAGDAQTLSLGAFNDFVAADDRVEAVILPLRDGISVIRKL